MDFSNFHEIIKRRSAIHDEWYTEVEKCWDEMIALFSQDIANLDVCTADEFSWLSEVFEGITEKTCCPDFVAALYRTAAKFPAEVKKYHLLAFIHSAENIVSCCSNDSAEGDCEN